MFNKIRSLFPKLKMSRAGFLISSAIFLSIFLKMAHGGSLFADTETATSQTISAEAFIASEAGAYFKSGDYEKALTAIDGMLREKPKDALLLRYKAIALDRSGKSDQAVVILKDLLLENTLHVPTHYFLGQAYSRMGQFDQAMSEWRWVVENGAGTPYQEWASDGLEKLGPTRMPAMPTEKKWLVQARYGYEYDSNVILRPDDESLASSRDHNAGRQNADLLLRYRSYSRRDLTVDLLYNVSQSMHDDSLNEFNYHSEEFGTNVRKRIQIGNQDVIAGLRYDFSLGFLDDNLFSTKNRWQVSADTRFTAKTRTVIFDEAALTDFGPDGFAPGTTSRDGFYNDVGAMHYFYSADFSRFVYLREEFNSGHARGTNFDFIGNTSRIGFHTPVVGRLDLDTSSGLELRFFHNFSSISALDASRRRNIDWDIYSALTYHVTDNLSLRGFYRFTNANNRNNFFDYTRHIGGAELTYTKSF